MHGRPRLKLGAAADNSRLALHLMGFFIILMILLALISSIILMEFLTPLSPLSWHGKTKATYVHVKRTLAALFIPSYVCFVFSFSLSLSLLSLSLFFFFFLFIFFPQKDLVN